MSKTPEHEGNAEESTEQTSDLTGASSVAPSQPHDADTFEASASAYTHLNPLSVQAASLVKSIDALSTIFWLCFLGFFLSIFFAGLAQLEGNTYTDFIFLGEYQVPKAILPLASFSFAVFAFWLVANRLNMLGYVLVSTNLSFTMVKEIFHLNPPVLHVFEKNNINPWQPFSGVSVFIFIWSVFFGNAISLIFSGTVTQGLAVGEFDPVLLGVYALALVLVILFGGRTIVPPLRNIITELHGEDFRLGWQRHVMSIVIIIGTLAINQSDQLSYASEQDDDMLGPAYANAIDGETLYMRGMEISLMGIDAVERDQICQDAQGLDYPCGQRATQALQELVQTDMVICLPIVNINPRRLLALCELTGDDQNMRPNDFLERFRPSSLARLMVVSGHAIGIGIGANRFAEEQLQAQTLRSGIWQGSFIPPRTWRADN